MSVRVTVSPSAHRERLAMRLLQNWTALHPGDKTTVSISPPTLPSIHPTVIGIRHIPRMRTGGFTHSTYAATAPPPPPAINQSSSSVSSDQNIDDSLTSLSWLQNLNVMKLAASAASATGQTRCSSSSSTTGAISTSANHYQHQASRPTGAVQPIQIQQPRRSMSSSSSLATCSVQRLGVDPNEVLDMSYLLTDTSNKTIKTEPDTIFGSPSSSVAVCAGRNVSPLLPPRLSPQPSTLNSDNSSSCGSVTGSTPSPPALQLASCGGTGSGMSVKPSHSYATLICMAMNDAADNRVTLSGIYSWIVDNFPYYQTADPSWQNSIRHNLSLNKCFQRVQRDKSDPPGKGSYWTLNPEFQQFVDRDLFRKRGANISGSHQQPPAKKPCRRSSHADDNRQRSKQRSGSGSHPRRQHRETAFEFQSVTDLRRTVSTGNEFAFGDEDKSELNPFESQSTVEVADFDGNFDLADALDMSWSAILGRNIGEQRVQPALHSQRQTSSQHQRPASASPTSGFMRRSTSSGTTGSTGTASNRDDDDDELDELIRACAETDNEDARLTSDAIANSSGRYVIGDGGLSDGPAAVFAEQTTPFGMSLEETEELLLGHHHDPLDLTVHGVGLRPPDWWNTLDIGDDFDGFAAVSVILGGNDERLSQQLQPARDEAPHPWAENRDRSSGAEGRHPGLDEVDDPVERNGLSRLFENSDLASSFDAGDQLLLMASSAETHEEFDEF